MSRGAVDAKGRRRSKTVCFRMSPEEADRLDLRAALSGLKKQDYIIQALLDPPVRTQATVRMLKAVKERLAPLCAELRRIRRAGDVPDGLAESIEAIAAFAGSFGGDPSPVDAEDEAIRSLERSLDRPAPSQGG